jgi:hypothetical protein
MTATPGDAVDRKIEWATTTLTQGELLADFVRHCADELDDVEVVEATPTSLVAQWRRERSRIELRAEMALADVVAAGVPTMLIGDLEPAGADLVERFLADAELRKSVCIVDPHRLEKLGTVRSSVFVYFEWFLRDAYGVKVLPVPSFTHGLIERGIIHLGMG